ncbi:MAG: hypothetical protein IKT62_05305 [Firmicutes bacterium]|nr:hypothetical protein [Bacillota bacterium]
MTEKEMRKLSRYQLLELLITQTNRVNELEEMLVEANLKIEQQEMELKSLGSIADTSNQLKEILEIAKTTTDAYINDAKERSIIMEAHAREEAARILINARKEAEEITEQLWINKYKI